MFSNGQVKIWNYETQTDLKTFEVTDVPVRCVRYIARKNWVSAGRSSKRMCLETSLSLRLALAFHTSAFC